MLSNSYSLQCNQLCNHPMCMAIVKPKATNILCLCSSIVCNKNKKGEEKQKLEKTKKKRKKTKKTKS